MCRGSGLKHCTSPVKLVQKDVVGVRLKGFEPSQLAIEAESFSSFHTREVGIERSVD